VAIRSKALFVTRVACSRSTGGMETQFGGFLCARCPAVFLHDDFVQIKTLPAIDSSHVLEGLTQVAVEYTYSQMCMYLHDSPNEIQTPTRHNLVGCRMTAPPPLLSPSSVLPPPSSQCTLIPVQKNSQNCSFLCFTLL